MGRDIAKQRAWMKKNTRTFHGWKLMENGEFEDTFGKRYLLNTSDVFSHARSNLPYYCERVGRSFHIPRTKLKRYKTTIRK